MPNAETLEDALRRVPGPPVLLVPAEDVESARDAVGALPADVYHPEVQPSPHQGDDWWLWQPLAGNPELALIEGDTTL